MNKREARIQAIGMLTSACSMAASGQGDAWPQYNDDDEPWTEREEDQLKRAFAELHDELARRLERLESHR